MDQLNAYLSDTDEEESARFAKKRRLENDRPSYEAKQFPVSDVSKDSKIWRIDDRTDGLAATDVTKPQKSLPSPGAIAGMFRDKQATVKDNPQEHGGRVRSFPHMEGNWASYVYIPVDADERLYAYVDEMLQCLRPLNFERMDDLHISLSKTVCIRHHWIQPLTESLSKCFQRLESCICGIGALKVYTNEEETRTFISLEICSPESKLMEYVSAVDSCFREFNLPGFYKDPSFHISLLSCVGDVTSEIFETRYEKIQTDADRVIFERLRRFKQGTRQLCLPEDRQ